MGRGYNGYFYSPKNNKNFFFRSLLELNYFIILEQDDTVINYTVEPFQIKLPNNHHYTPDVLVNNLSFSHIREIMVLNDAFERFFLRNRAYEMQLECKRTNQI